MLRLLVLLIAVYDSLGQIPEDFCTDAPPVLRGNHYVIVTNETWFNFQRGLDGKNSMLVMLLRLVQQITETDSAFTIMVHSLLYILLLTFSLF